MSDAENTSQASAAATTQQPPASPAPETPAAEAPATNPNPGIEAQVAKPQASQETAQPQAKDDDGLLTAEDPAAKTLDQKAQGQEPTAEQPNIFGAPEGDYKFEEIPEGANGVGISGFVSAVKELNLNQETAQALLSKSLAGIQADRAAERSALRQETLSDAGLNWRNPAVQQQANAAFRMYFGEHPRIQAKLKALNLDVDREFLGIMHRLGGDVSQGSFVQGNKQGSDESDFRRMYPATKMNR